MFAAVLCTKFFSLSELAKFALLEAPSNSVLPLLLNISNREIKCITDLEKKILLHCLCSPCAKSILNEANCIFSQQQNMITIAFNETRK